MSRACVCAVADANHREYLQDTPYDPSVSFNISGTSKKSPTSFRWRGSE